MFKCHILSFMDPVPKSLKCRGIICVLEVVDVKKFENHFSACKPFVTFTRVHIFIHDLVETIIQVATCS